MAKNIELIVNEAKASFDACKNQNDLNQAKALYLGKKGPISEVMATMRELSI